MSPRAGFLRSTLVLTSSSVARIVIVFALQMVMAVKFGARVEMDAFLAASTLPTMISAILIEQLNVTLIPVLVESRIKKGESETRVLVGSFVNTGFVLLTSFAILTTIGGDFIVRVTVPGFAHGSQNFLLTARLLRVLLPSVVFAGLAGLLNGVFYAERRFFLPSLASIANGVVSLAVTFGFAGSLGIMSVAVGTLAGSAIQFAVLFFVLVNEGRYCFRLQFSHPGVIRVLRLTAPLVVGAMFYKASPLIDRFIASGLPEGSISYLGYAFKIVSTLLFLVTHGIAVSFLPMMSEYAATNDIDGLRKSLSLGIGGMTFVVAPLITALAVLGEPLIRILFERGAFNHQATIGANSAMLWYLGWLYACAVGTIQTNALFSLQDTTTVVKVGIIATLFEIVLAVVLSRTLGFGGLALSLTLISVGSMIAFSVVLRERLKSPDIGHIDRTHNHLFSSQAKMWFSCFIMAGVILGANFLLKGVVGTNDGPTLREGASLVVSTLTGLACYLGLTWLLRCEVMIYLLSQVRRFFFPPISSKVSRIL